MRAGLLLTLGFVFLGAPTVRAEHARIDLRIIHLDPQTGRDREEATAHADAEPPLGGSYPRPLCKVTAGAPLAAQFILINTYPHGEKKDVIVRYYVVREAKPGQKEHASPKNGAVTQGEFTLNFKPKCRVGARIAFKIEQPGCYLLRVETDRTDSDHEHFSAIDLQVE